MPAAAVSRDALHGVVPTGRSLPAPDWERRHRGMLVLLAVHAVGLAIFGLLMRARPEHAIAEGAIVGAIGLLAAWPRLPRRVRAVVASFGLVSASAVLVHLSGGYIEAHFHFFVMLGVVFLYEDWLPYMLAVGYVAVHHGIVGSLDPASVYNHPAAFAAPWTWAGIHALFIVGLSAALLVAWNVIDRARRAESTAERAAEDMKRQLHAQEKMAALGTLVAGLAHEVRTPLTVVATTASLVGLEARRLHDAGAGERVASHARQIQASVDRINGLVAQLRRFHRLEPDARILVPLEPVVLEAVELFRSAHKGRLSLRTELRSTPPTSLSPLGVQQVVLNLLANAVEAVGAEGTVTVRTLTEDGRAVLVVEDDGGGMAPHVQQRIFEPLFTTKPDGMGLGLSIVRRIVEAHDAEIDFVSAAGKGTRFTVRFPPAAATRAATATASPLAP